jgi:hypothetical protein
MWDHANKRLIQIADLYWMEKTEQVNSMRSDRTAQNLLMCESK